jgi:hypothetical protein
MQDHTHGVAARQRVLRQVFGLRGGLELEVAAVPRARPVRAGERDVDLVVDGPGRGPVLAAGQLQTRGVDGDLEGPVQEDLVVDGDGA